MTRFIVRVELHYASEAQYQQLHSLMLARGLLRYIVADNGSKYWLPPAEYYYAGNASRVDVLSTAKACAAAVVSGYAVLVTEATAVTWEGLQAAA